jgi:mRNA interferase HigB
MRVISNKSLLTFASIHAEAQGPLQTWRCLVEESGFASFAEIKATFNSVDKVGEFFVFNVGGNKYRLVAAIHFNRQMLFIRYVFTHKEYDKWKP